jgi:hypothetical protein
MTASSPGNADVGGLGNMLYRGAFRYPAQGPSCALSETTGCFSILQGWRHDEPPDYAESLICE